LGSLFAHQSFKNFNTQFPEHSKFSQENQNIGLENPFPIPRGIDGTFFDLGHQEIDRQFSSNYASLYTNLNNETDFNTLSYQLRGEIALASGYLNKPFTI